MLKSILNNPIQAVININGEIKSEEESLTPWVSVFDRSYLYGDSLYEVARTYQGRFFHLEEHLIRLFKSASLCHMPLHQPITFYQNECVKTLLAFQEKHREEAYCRIILSRGVGKIGFGEENIITPLSFAIIVQPLALPSPVQFKTGIQLQISKNRIRNHPHAIDPAMKSGNYLNSLLAYLEARKEGYEDALLCDFQGFITEGTTFNVFYIKRGILVTPPLDVGILDGITRRHTIEVAKKIGMEVREVRFTPSHLYQSDETFATSTTKEIIAVTQLDHQTIGKGVPGPLTLKLAQELKKDIERKLHPHE